MSHLQFGNHGTPETALHLIETPPKPLADGHVRVQMHAAPINPSDLLHVRGEYGAEVTPPAQVGFEGVGVVTESNAGLLGSLLKSKRVAVLSRTGGTWAETCDVPAKSVIPIPRSLSLQAAATFFINPATAYIMTKRVLNVPLGAWLLQSAANSAVGRMVIQLGQHFGFRSANLVRHAEQEEQLRQLGADQTYVLNGSEDVSALHEWLGDEVRFGLDPVGGSIGSLVAGSLGEGGRFVSYGSLSNEPLAIDPRILLSRGQTLTGFWLGPYMDELSLLQKISLIQTLKGLHKQGVFKIPDAITFPLAAYHEAIAAAESSTGGNKVLLVMNETSANP